MKFFFACSLALAAWIVNPAAALCKDQPGTQQSARLDAEIKVRIDYLLYLPKDYAAKESWPLLLFLHGAGERGDDLELVKKHGPPKRIAQGKEFPFIVVSPQCPKDRWWEPMELLALLDDISRNYKVDPDRICVTGLSMGGFGTWRLAFYAPEKFAAIAPICGGGETYWAKRIARLPVWAFHGGKDPGVPVARSESMIAAIKKSGGDAMLTIYPEAGHDAWTETYDNPKLYEWLLEQKRSPREPSENKERPRS